MSDRPSAILSRLGFERIEKGVIKDIPEASRNRKSFTCIWTSGDPNTYAIDEDGLVWIYSVADVDLSNRGFEIMSGQHFLQLFWPPINARIKRIS